jgi:hypothetical protein
MAHLSEWLELMLAEIARRQEEAQLNAEEEARRVREQPGPSTAASAIESSAHAPSTASSETVDAGSALASNERRRRRG